MKLLPSKLVLHCRPMAIDHGASVRVHNHVASVRLLAGVVYAVGGLIRLGTVYCQHLLQPV